MSRVPCILWAHTHAHPGRPRDYYTALPYDCPAYDSLFSFLIIESAFRICACGVAQLGRRAMAQPPVA
eukprot:21210-Eustigmatos_ZCMA.PRE.1